MFHGYVKDAKVSRHPKEAGARKQPAQTKSPFQANQASKIAALPRGLSALQAPGKPIRHSSFQMEATDPCN